MEVVQDEDAESPLARIWVVEPNLDRSIVDCDRLEPYLSFVVDVRQSLSFGRCAASHGLKQVGILGEASSGGLVLTIGHKYTSRGIEYIAV